MKYRLIEHTSRPYLNGFGEMIEDIEYRIEYRSWPWLPWDTLTSYRSLEHAEHVFRFIMQNKGISKTVILKEYP